MPRQEGRPQSAEAPPGVYRCTVCGEQIRLEIRRVLTPCTVCFNAYWEPAEADV
jgi:hypothetical protein